MKNRNNFKVHTNCFWCKNNSLISVTKRIDDIKVLQCPKCKLLMVESIPKKISNIYKSDYYFSEPGKSKYEYENYGDYIENNTFGKYGLIKKYTNDKYNTILDLGCGLGGILDLAKQDGKKTFGLEISKFAVNVCQNKGHNVSYSNLSYLPYKDKTIDVITAFDLIEHVTNPKGLLQEIKRVLKPSGIFIYTTLFVENPLTDIDWFQTSLEHLIYYSSQAFQNFLQEIFPDNMNLVNIDQKNQLIYGGSAKTINELKNTDDIFVTIFNNYINKPIQNIKSERTNYISQIDKLVLDKNYEEASKRIIITDINDYILMQYKLKIDKEIIKDLSFHSKEWEKASRSQDILIKERDNYIKTLENNNTVNNSIVYLDSGNKKIAFLLGSPDISGGTYVIFQHALALQKQGYHVTIVTENSFDKSRLFWYSEAAKLKFINLENASQEIFDICIATWWKTVFYLPKINSRKFAYFVQSIESKFCQDQQSDLAKMIETTYDLPLNYITEAHWIQKYLKDIHNQKAKLVLNGIDKDLFNIKGKTIDNSRPLGVRVLIEGALNVFFKQTEIAVQVAKKAGVKDIWLLTPTTTDHFPGTTKTFSNIPTNKVPEIMRSCDIILKLSKVEGMFGPPLEMMHCGGTTVTFNVTGYDEYIKDGVNGLVYEMDDFKGITDGLSKLINDPIYLAKLKKHGLNTAKNWPDWNTSGQNFVKIIENITEDKNIQPVESIKKLINQINNIFTFHSRYPITIMSQFKKFVKTIVLKIFLK